MAQCRTVVVDGPDHVRTTYRCLLEPKHAKPHEFMGPNGIVHLPRGFRWSKPTPTHVTTMGVSGHVVVPRTQP